jgi:hypothetical protein
MCVYISPADYRYGIGMKRSEQEHKEDLSYLRAKLALPEPEIDAWLNGIVDGWIADRRIKRARTKHA